MEGCVYVISNKAMPGLFKVGFTTRSPEERAAELSGTGLPYPSMVEFSVEVQNAATVEREAHRLLATLRVSPDREWFQCSRAEAITAIKKAAGTVVRKEKDRVVEEERRRAAQADAQRKEEARQRKEGAIKARNVAREAARQAIVDRYAPQLAALADVPHFVIFWMIGGAIVSALFIFTLPANKDPSFALFVFSFGFGAIPGVVLQECVQNKKKKSKAYVDLEAKRNAELDALSKQYSTQSPAAGPGGSSPQRASSTSNATAVASKQATSASDAASTGTGASIVTGYLRE